MKISEMTTDKAADVLMRITDPVANIMHDADTMSLIEKMANGTDNPIKFIADNIVSVSTVLLKNHREDMFEIIAAMSDKTADEVSKQKFPQTIKDIRGCWDGELADFFGSQV